MGGEGFLTLTIKMRVRPEPECEEELVDLLKTETRSTTQSRRSSRRRPHRFLGPTRFSTESSRRLSTPARIAMDCYREALSIAKSWLSNPKKGTMPKAKTLRLWLTPSLSYGIKGNYVEVLGGYRLRIVG
jgi:putative transposase